MGLALEERYAPQQLHVTDKASLKGCKAAQAHLLMREVNEGGMAEDSATAKVSGWNVTREVRTPVLVEGTITPVQF